MSLQIFFINVSIIFFSLFNKLVVFFFKIGWTHLQPFASRPQLPNSVTPSAQTVLPCWPDSVAHPVHCGAWAVWGVEFLVILNGWHKQPTYQHKSSHTHTILHMLITSYPIRIICSSKITPDLLEEIAWNSWSQALFFSTDFVRENTIAGSCLSILSS